MPKKSLIVDDDFFFVEFLGDLLAKRGHKVIKAYDGKEGISRLEEETVDYIFVDLLIPKIDAMQLIEYVRRKFRESDIIIIAVSGNIIEQSDQLEKVGANFYIAKGPTESMLYQLNSFMDKIEGSPFLDTKGFEFVEPVKLFPRQATAQLMDRMNFERAVIESIGMGVFVVDKDARIMRANSLALNILGRSLEEVLNKPITAIVPSGKKESLVHVLKKVVRDPKTKKLEHFATIHSREIRMIVSSFRINDEMSGWIIAIENADTLERADKSYEF